MVLRWPYGLHQHSFNKNNMLLQERIYGAQQNVNGIMYHIELQKEAIRTNRELIGGMGEETRSELDLATNRFEEDTLLVIENLKNELEAAKKKSADLISNQHLGS